MGSGVFSWWAALHGGLLCLMLPLRAAGKPVCLSRRGGTFPPAGRKVPVPDAFASFLSL